MRKKAALASKEPRGIYSIAKPHLSSLMLFSLSSPRCTETLQNGKLGSYQYEYQNPNDRSEGTIEN
jgi:hypothetical protein